VTVVAIVVTAVAAILAIRVAYHMQHLWALRRWLRRPQLDKLPEGRGVWEEVLAELHRFLRHRDAEHDTLARSLARFRAAVRALPDGVVILDREHRIEWSNPTAAHHFGIDARRDLGQPVVNLIRQPDFVAHLAAGDFSRPLILRARDTTLALQLIEFGDEQKLLNSRDITAEERIDTMRRDFVANVSHELKTPVTVLSGFVETLADESLPITPQQRGRYLLLMAEQATRMQRLVEDLLTLSALESSAAPAVARPIEMRAFLHELTEEARALSAGRHRIQCSVHDDCRLLGSEAELRSAFSNLVSNAVRYTPEGGLVALAWHLAPDGGGVFSVSDSGIGIEARHIPRLTERFYRVDSGRSRESGGTGLGLAIVKHALTRHQAVLNVTSEPGRGSTFGAQFPPGRVLPPGKRQEAA
jgi:two-component system phosphate regulon sensor histidine kinase PhoR